MIGQPGAVHHVGKGAHLGGVQLGLGYRLKDADGLPILRQRLLLHAAVPEIVHVVGARHRHSIAQRLPVARAALVHRERLVLHRHHELLRPGAYPLRRRLRPLRQDVADALALGDLARQLDHRLGVAKVQLQPVGPLLAEQPLLVALHGEGDHHPRGDGVQAVGVADLVGHADGTQIIDATVGAKRAHRLVFGSAVLGVDLVLVVINLDDTLAVDGAGIAAAAINGDSIAESDAIDLGRPLELAILKVARGQSPHLVEAREAGVRALIVRAPGQVLPVGRHPAAQLTDLFLIGHRHTGLATGHDRLEVFRAHHRADARPPGGMLDVIDDARIAHELFAARPDHGHPGTPFTQLFGNRLLGLEGRLAPEVLRGAQLCLTVVDPQVDGLVRLALHHHGIETRLFHLGAEKAAHVRLTVPTRERRLAAHGAAPCPSHRDTRDGAASKDEGIVGPERIGALGDLLQQVVADESVATDIPPIEGIRGLLSPDLARCQVDPQYLACVPLCHREPPFCDWHTGVPSARSAP